MNRIVNLLVLGQDNLPQTVIGLEDQEDVVIARVENSDDNELLNTRVRAAFLDKGIGLEDYWLWNMWAWMVIL